MKVQTLFTLVSVLAVAGLSLFSCDIQTPQGTTNRASTTRDVKQVARRETDIVTGVDGLTIEQHNIKARLELDNKPGAFKHLYIVNGQGSCIFYDTVKGKVTSSQKRLYPYENVQTYGTYEHQSVHGVENMGYDGTFGSSSEYIYWWNVNGAYRQLQVGNTNTVLITEVPVRFKEVAIDLSIEHTQSAPAVLPEKPQEKK